MPIVEIEIWGLPSRPREKLSGTKENMKFREKIAQGATIRQAFEKIARKSKIVREHIYSIEDRKFQFHTVVVRNGKILQGFQLETIALEDQDNVQVILVAGGG